MKIISSSLGQSTTKQSSLRFRLFGPPNVIWNDITLSIPRRLVRALLFRLACDKEPVTRGHLHLLFWPDIPETTARRNLSHCLTHLRRAIPIPQILVTTTEVVTLDWDHTWCDVLEFKKTLFHSIADASLLRHLVDLYRGPFLDGFNLPGCPEFEQWCIVERSSLEHHYLKILETLIERCSDAGEVSQAVEYAEQYVETDPLAEIIHRRLIQLYAAKGERHLALRQYERCSSNLESELGVEPLPQTQAVYQAVLRGQNRFPEPTSTMHLPHLPVIEARIIGREEELNRLEKAFLGLQNWQGQVVLISGEAGIGKSRLMGDFAKQHQGNARLLCGSGYAGEQVIPYQPILDMVRSILCLGERGLESQNDEFLIEASLVNIFEPIWLSEISRLLPEIHSNYPALPLPLPLEPDSARTRLFDALSQLILAYANTHGPVMLCLDDMQWMDATTKAWLVHIGRFISRSAYPLLILGTYRSEDAEEVLEVRHSLAREGILIELRLTGLSDSAVLELLNHLVGRRSGDEMLADYLHQATGGNPFYLIEIVHKLIEEERLEEHFQESMQFALPESVREAIQARLGRLSPMARQVLEAGAVLGQSFDIELLRLTAGRSHIEIISALKELVVRVLLVEAEQEYRFNHELIRQHVEEGLGQVRLQLLHRRAGRAYQRFKPDAFSALAYHFELGGHLHKALHYHGLATRNARAMYAWLVVEFHQGRMLDLLDSIDPSRTQVENVHQRGDILAERANALHLLDRLVERDADLQELSDLGEASSDDQIRLLAILNRLRYLNLDGEYNQAIRVAENGLYLLESSPTLSRETEQVRVTRSRLLAQNGLAYYYLGKPSEALGVLEEAWSLCEETIDPQACGRILHILGYVYSHLGDCARSLDYQQQAYAYHMEAGDTSRMAWDLIDIGALYGNIGDLDRARCVLEEGLELSSRIGSNQVKAYGLAHLGSLSLYRGEYAPAVANFQQSLALQQGAHSEHVLATAEAGLGLSLYHLGDYVQSRHWLERARQRAQANNYRRRIAKTLIQLGLLDTVEGRLPLARQHLEGGLTIAQDSQSEDCLAAGLIVSGRTERLSGDPHCARQMIGQAMDLARRVNSTCLQMWSEVETGLAYLALGDPMSALEHTQGAVRLAAQASQDWVGCEEAYRAHARVLRALNQGQAADLQEAYAREAIQVKADLIPDPLQRRRYLEVSV